LYHSNSESRETNGASVAGWLSPRRELPRPVRRKVALRCPNATGFQSEWGGGRGVASAKCQVGIGMVCIRVPGIRSTCCHLKIFTLAILDRCWMADYSQTLLHLRLLNYYTLYPSTRYYYTSILNGYCTVLRPLLRTPLHSNPYWTLRHSASHFWTIYSPRPLLLNKSSLHPSSYF
jgi:hypothetical protein